MVVPSSVVLAFCGIFDLFDSLRRSETESGKGKGHSLHAPILKKVVWTTV